MVKLLRRQGGRRMDEWRQGAPGLGAPCLSAGADRGD